MRRTCKSPDGIRAFPIECIKERAGLPDRQKPALFPTILERSRCVGHRRDDCKGLKVNAHLSDFVTALLKSLLNDNTCPFNGGSGILDYRDQAKKVHSRWPENRQ